MSRRGEECWFKPVYTDDNDSKLPNDKELMREGYFEFWGNSGNIVWYRVGDMQFPIMQPLTIGFVRDKATGQVYECYPSDIKFHVNDKFTNKP